MASHCLRSGFPVSSSWVNGVYASKKGMNAAYNLRGHAPHLRCQHLVLCRAAAVGPSRPRTRWSSLCKLFRAGKGPRFLPCRLFTSVFPTQFTRRAGKRLRTSAIAEALLQLFDERMQVKVAGLVPRGALRLALALRRGWHWHWPWPWSWVSTSLHSKPRRRQRRRGWARIRANGVYREGSCGRPTKMFHVRESRALTEQHVRF